jgi:hypothetical protein
MNPILSRLDQVRSFWGLTTGTQWADLSTALPRDLVRRRLYLGWFINPNDPTLGPLTDYSVEGRVQFTLGGNEVFRLPVSFTDKRSGSQPTDGTPVGGVVLPPWSVSRVDRNAGATLQDLDTGAGDDDLVTVFDVPEGAYDWLVALRCSPLRCSCYADAVRWSGTMTAPAVGTFSIGAFLAVQSEGRA